MKKIFKFFKKVFFIVFIFLTNYTIYFTGESNKIILKGNSDLEKLIYISWGFIGCLLLSFFLFIGFDFFVIQSNFIIEKSILFRVLVIIIPTIIIYNIYFLAYRTLYLRLTINSILTTVIKTVLISLLLFFFTFPFVYNNNFELLEKKNIVYRDSVLIKQEYLINVNTINKIKKLSKNNTYTINVKEELYNNKTLKEYIKQNLLKSDLIFNRILSTYEHKSFLMNYFMIVLFFNSIFVVKIVLIFFDVNYKMLNENEDKKVEDNVNFST